ncbi:MAG: ornithine cyclodeaminase family protein [Bacteroidota bacterium]
MDTLLLTGDDVHQIARRVGLDALMDALIARLTEAFEAYDAATTHIPERDGLTYTAPVTGLLEWMPCRQGTEATVKTVGYHPENPARLGVPTILSTVSGYDTESGHLRCLMDGTLLTALRTGAASAVATDRLAAPDAETVGLIGAGAQAVTQLHALLRVRDVRRVLAYDTHPATLASFADRVAAIAPDLPIEAAGPEAVVAASDILCTATSVEIGGGPVFAETAALPPHAHVNAVGSDFPGKVELPAALLRRALVCPDFRAQAVREGECQQLAPKAIGPALYEVLQDPGAYAEAWRGLTVFDSTGWALEDHVALGLFVDYATAWEIGTRLPIEAIADDPHAPYAFARRPAALAALAS